MQRSSVEPSGRLPILKGPTAVERLLNAEVVDFYESLGERYGWGKQGAIAALRTDATLRGAAHSAYTRSLRDSWFGCISAAWHLCGRPSYWPSSPLVDGLLATDLRDAPMEATLSPWPVFHVELPAGNHVQLETRSGTPPASGILCVADIDIYDAAADAIRPWDLHPIPGRPVAPAPLLLEAPAVPPANPVLGIIPIWNGSAKEATLAWYSLTLDDANLDAVVERSSLATRTLLGIDSRGEARAHLSLILTLLLYVNSEGAEVEPLRFTPEREGGSSPHARQIRARLKRRWGSRILLGRQLAEARSPGDEARPGVRLHLVRGHFRREGPVEAGRARWIKPYWRGLEEFGRTVESRYERK